MSTQLPVEIIGRIIHLIYYSSSKRKTILPLLLVSPTFRIETERLLYSHICLTTVAQVVRCFQMIDSRPTVPRTVRQLHVSLELDSTPPRMGLFDFLNTDGAFLTDQQVQRAREERVVKQTGKVLRAFGDLVTRTLNKLASLQEYSLSLSERPGRDEPVFAPMWLPTEAPFKLRRFIVDLNLSPAMTRFLQSQAGIIDLLAPHFTHQQGRLPLPPGSLPKLRGLAVSPEAASFIVPGRPVKRIVLKQSKSRQPLESIVNAIPSLAQSSIPVKSIDLALLQLSPAPELVLRPLAASLPHLEQIILRRGFILVNEKTVYDVYESDAFASALAEFPRLKTFHIPAPSAYHHTREAGIMNQMQDSFGGALGGSLTIEASINGNIFATNQPPGQPLQAPPVIFGPPFPAPNGNENANGNPGGVLGAGAGAGGEILGMGGGFFTIPLGGGFLGGGMVPGPPPLPAGQAAGNAGNPPPPPAADPGAGELPGLFQNLFGFGQPLPNPNANGNANDAGPPPPVPAAGQALELIPENFDDLPPLMDDPGDGEVVADFFVVTAGPMEGDQGGDADEQDANPEGQQAQPQQGDPNPHPAQPDGANAAPPPPPLPPFNLNQMLHQATNLIMQQLQNQLQAQFGGVVAGGAAAGGAANPNPAAPPNANANAAPTPGANAPPNLTVAATLNESDALPPLEPLAGPGPAGPAANAGAAAAPPPPGGPAPPMNFQTTFVTAWNTQTGEVLTDAGANPPEATPSASTPRLTFNDPEVAEILDKGQRELKSRELKVLDKWKLGGYTPSLKTVIFDMDPPVRSRTIWTWKENAPSAPQPANSRLTTVSDGDEDVYVEVRNVVDDAVEASSSVEGKWEVEYTSRGPLTSVL